MVVRDDLLQLSETQKLLLAAQSYWELCDKATGEQKEFVIWVIKNIDKRDTWQFHQRLFEQMKTHGQERRTKGGWGNTYAALLHLLRALDPRIKKITPHDTYFISLSLSASAGAAKRKKRKDIQINILEDMLLPILTTKLTPSTIPGHMQELAEEIYRTKNFHLNGILADMVEDFTGVNCTTANHLREKDRQHWKGCWAIELCRGAIF